MKPSATHDRATRTSASSRPALSIKKADFVVALARGLDIIRLFSDDRPRLTTSDAAALTGLSRAAARRFLLTLRELGYLKSEGDYFEPHPRLLELGYSYVSTWNFPQLVTPYLKQVVDELHENCSFAILDDADVIYLARSEARRIVQSITISVGTRVPATLSSLGRVLLASQPTEIVDELLDRQKIDGRAAHIIIDPLLFHQRLEAVRTQGWALVDGEFEKGLLSIAVPVLGYDGNVVGAINVGAPDSRASPELMVQRFLPVLQRAASGISCMLKTSGKSIIV